MVDSCIVPLTLLNKTFLNFDRKNKYFGICLTSSFALLVFQKCEFLRRLLVVSIVKKSMSHTEPNICE